MHDARRRAKRSVNRRAAIVPLLIAGLALVGSVGPARGGEVGLDLLEEKPAQPPLPAPEQPKPALRQRPNDPPPKVKKGLFADFLAGPLAGVDEIVFAVRPYGNDGHWYANFGYWVSDPDRKMYGIGGRLCRMNLRTRKVTDILADEQGGIRDPQVHYDAQKILFSYRKGGTDHYHLYEIKLDGTGLRQLTDGDCDDIEPIYLPDGDILFCSSRCNRYVQCWYTHVAVLYRCGPDGENVRLISANVEHDNTPWLLPDGRVLYTRWEYVDRSQVSFHHLWTANPDGTGVMNYFGNLIPGLLMIDAKPIPGTQKVVAVFSPGHGRQSHAGNIAIIDPSAGPDEYRFAPVITQRADWRDPYPVTEDCFLVARENGLFVMDGKGYYEELHTVAGPNMRAHEPRPLRPRPRERAMPKRTNWAKATGTLILTDITRGRNMAGVERGEIRKLLVLETLPKPVNFSGGMDAISPGGSFTIPRILGTVPVEPDGSACFEAPALRPIFFVALDGKNLSVKRMQSFTNVMPGETTGCVGCHERRTDAPISAHGGALLALSRPPSPITPIPNMPDVIDFSTHIQPILDAHCTTCHHPKAPAEKSGRVILTGTRGSPSSLWPVSYTTLFRFVAQGANANGNRAPRTLGSSASPLMKLIQPTHHDVQLSDDEQTLVWMWIEAGAVYPGSYASLGTGGTGMFSAYHILAPRCGSCHGYRAADGSTQLRFAASEGEQWDFERPEGSLLLRAPLAKEAGGLGLCRGEYLLFPSGLTTPPRRPDPRKAGKLEADPLDAELEDLLAEDKPAAARSAATGLPVTRHVAAIFADRDDPDYQKILCLVRKHPPGREAFGLAGFRPNEHYIREMKRYGILDKSYTPDQPIDVFALDRAYWKSFWYDPAKAMSSR